MPCVWVMSRRGERWCVLPADPALVDIDRQRWLEKGHAPVSHQRAHRRPDVDHGQPANRGETKRRALRHEGRTRCPVVAAVGGIDRFQPRRARGQRNRRSNDRDPGRHELRLSPSTQSLLCHAGTASRSGCRGSRRAGTAPDERNRAGAACLRASDRPSCRSRLPW